MARPLRVAVLGWSCGFALALLAGARQANSPALASILLAAALTSMSAVGVLLVFTMVRDRQDAREATDEEAADNLVPNTVTVAEPSSPAERAPAAREAQRAPTASGAELAAARVAELEARLALEERELEAVAAALAAAGAEDGEPVRPEPEENPAAIEEEPVLRRELLNAVTDLVGRGDAGAGSARELEELLRSRS